MSDAAKKLEQAIRDLGLQGKELKDVLREAVSATWPDLPPWSTLPGPVIEEVQKASIGSGVVLTFVEDGVRKVVLGRAGAHYDTGTTPSGRRIPAYTIPGGFIDLTSTKGSMMVPPSAEPEDPRTGAAREVEEEFRMPDGAPMLAVSPARLKPMDTKTIAFRSGEKRVVIGMMLEMTVAEISRAKAHSMKIASDMDYAYAIAARSINPASGKPEIEHVEIFNLDDVVAGRVNLLHKDQQSLFGLVKAHFDAMPRPQAPRRGWWPV